MVHFFYSKSDTTKEPITRVNNMCSRLDAAKYFAKLKNMSLKTFLRVFSVGVCKK